MARRGQDNRLVEIVRSCFVDVEVRNKHGETGRGFTNLKRLYGDPERLLFVASAMARTVRRARAIAAADLGSAPFATAVALERRLPLVLVRAGAKGYFLSYGADPSADVPELIGEALPLGTSVHVVDDLLSTGQTARRAIGLLRSAGLVVTEMTCVLSGPSRQDLQAIARDLGIERIHALATADETFGG